ncbi:hypothetical protein Tco_0779315 [Tanacetum coccineum]
MKAGLKQCKKNCFSSNYRRFWILVDLPFGKKEIGTKWVFRNKRDERNIVVVFSFCIVHGISCLPNGLLRVGLSMKTVEHILALEDGTEIHMLAKRRYPRIRETLERMMELRLTAKSEGEAIFNLLRFIQKQIDEFGD